MKRIWNTTITEVLLGQGSGLPIQAKTQGKSPTSTGFQFEIL